MSLSRLIQSLSDANLNLRYPFHIHRARPIHPMSLRHPAAQMAGHGLRRKRQRLEHPDLRTRSTHYTRRHLLRPTRSPTPLLSPHLRTKLSRADRSRLELRALPSTTPTPTLLVPLQASPGRLLASAHQKQALMTHVQLTPRYETWRLGQIYHRPSRTPRSGYRRWSQAESDLYA